MPGEIIDLQAQRQAVAAAKATAMLCDVLRDAAKRVAHGGLSDEYRAELVDNLIRVLVDFADAGGWSAAFHSDDAARPKDAALNKVLCLAAEEAATQVLSAERRAIVINSVFLVLGGWRVSAPPDTAAKQVQAPPSAGQDCPWRRRPN